MPDFRITDLPAAVLADISEHDPIEMADLATSQSLKVTVALWRQRMFTSPDTPLSLGTAPPSVGSIRVDASTFGGVVLSAQRAAHQMQLSQLASGDVELRVLTGTGRIDFAPENATSVVRFAHGTYTFGVDATDHSHSLIVGSTATGAPTAPRTSSIDVRAPSSATHQGTVVMALDSGNAYLRFREEGAQHWTLYKLRADPVLRLYDEVNSRLHVAFTRGASTATALTEFFSQVVVGSDPGGTDILRAGGNALISAGTDSPTTLTLGQGGSAPTTWRAVTINLNAPSSGAFVGSASTSLSRAGTLVWSVGIDQVGASGAKSTNTDLYFFALGSGYVAALTTGGQLRLAGDVVVAGNRVVSTRRTGWATATGTATRTAFDTATVTLTQLAERVKALIDDLHATAGHGLIGT